MRILLVEDDPLTVTDLSAALDDGGHSVVAVADTLRDAIAAVSLNDIDLALVDVVLRDGRTGLDAVMLLRRHFQVPAILVSGERDLRSKAESAGAAGYLCKPTRPTELLRLLGSEPHIAPARRKPETFC